MKILQRYFTSLIMKAVFFVLIAFLALFSFFDLVNEISSVGRGAYRLRHAFLYILLSMPGYIYELLPVAVLIGTIYALARLAANSEFTIMRASSMSTFQVGMILVKIGVVFMVLTLLVGEFITPYTSTKASQLRDGLLLRDRKLEGQFRSGIWSKDTIYKQGLEGEVTGSRFINIGGVRTDHSVHDVHFYEFDLKRQLRRIVYAKSGVYLGGQQWELTDVTEDLITAPARVGEVRFPQSSPTYKTKSFTKMVIVSELTPDILSVLAVDATKMSAYDLAIYNRHMEANHQDTAAYKIAFWKKIIYPFSVFVMLGLALPFAYLHFRSGGISVKIFTGIMIGVLFMLLNSLFSHVGLLNTWPAFLTAVIPSVIFLLFALFALWWIERH